MDFEQIDSSAIYDYPRDAKGAEGVRLTSQNGETPYMIKIEDMPESFLKPFVPMWKTLQMLNASSLEKMLKKWNSEIKPWHETKAKETHVSMSKASFSVPDDKEHDFLRHYALGITMGCKFFLVEQLTPVFRLFVDLDIAQLAGVKEYQMEGASFIVQRTVQKFYPDVDADDPDTLRAIVCTTTYKKVVKKDGVDLVKSGIHIHFPFLFVTRTEALHIRESCVAELEGSGAGLGKRVPPNNSWREAYDETVYGKGAKGGGLRMVGSRKTDNCAVCNGRPRKKGDTAPLCDACNGEGKVDSGRPYFPLLVLRAPAAGATRSARDLKVERDYLDNFESLIRDTKVRTQFKTIPNEPRFCIPESAPMYIETAKVAKGLPGQKTLTLKGNVSNTDPAWDALQTAIRDSAPRYADVVLQSVTSNSKRTFYSVHVSGENSRFCQNINREHSRNRIFFSVTPDGVSQRCHDSATEQSAEMRFGLCATYQSGYYTLSSRLLGILFGKKTIGQTPSRALAYAEDDVRIVCDKKLVGTVAYLDFLCSELGYSAWSSSVSISGQRIVRRSSEPTFTTIDPSALGSTASRTLRTMGLEQESQELPEDEPAPRTSISRLETNLLRIMETWVDVAANLEQDEVANLWTRARDCELPVEDWGVRDLSDLYRED